MTTIGLGDLVAGVKGGQNGWYLAYIQFWLLFGFGWLSLIITLAVEIYNARATYAVQAVSKSLAKATKVTRRSSFSGTRNIAVVGNDYLQRELTMIQAAIEYEQEQNGGKGLVERAKSTGDLEQLRNIVDGRLKSRKHKRDASMQLNTTLEEDENEDLNEITRIVDLDRNGIINSIEERTGSGILLVLRGRSNSSP